MNINEVQAFEQELDTKCKVLSKLSLREIKKVLRNPQIGERMKTIYRLEAHWRLEGGETPYTRIMTKVVNEHKFAFVRVTQISFSEV
jgi:hypothetical protein